MPDDSILKLRELEKRLVIDDLAAALMQAAPDAILIVDNDRSITMANIQAEFLFGCARGLLVGKRVEELMPDRFREIHVVHFTRYMDNPVVRPMGLALQIFVLRSDGKEIPVEIALGPCFTPRGLFIVAIIRRTRNLSADA